MAPGVRVIVTVKRLGRQAGLSSVGTIDGPGPLVSLGVTQSDECSGLGEGVEGKHLVPWRVGRA